MVDKIARWIAKIVGQNVKKKLSDIAAEGTIRMRLRVRLLLRQRLQRHRVKYGHWPKVYLFRRPRARHQLKPECFRYKHYRARSA